MGAVRHRRCGANLIIKLDGLSSAIYDHPLVSAQAQAAIFYAIPVGLSVDEAKMRLERSGMRCVTDVVLRCYASIFENVDDRDYASIMWHVAICSENGRVSDVRAEVN